MFDTNDQAEFLGRAEMHEQLAGSTGDVPARKMHLAMASEYRRRAMAAGGVLESCELRQAG